MYRTINLIRVAVSFFVAFTQGRNVEEFLASHTGSLRTVYRTALLFRGFVQDTINGSCHLSMPSTPLNDENEVRGPNDFSRDAVRSQGSLLQDAEYSQQGSIRIGLQLRDFLPGISKQKDVMDAQILRMSPAKFSTLCTDSLSATNEHVEERDAINSSARAAIVPNECNEDWEDHSDDGFDFGHLFDAEDLGVDV